MPSPARHLMRRAARRRGAALVAGTFVAGTLVAGTLVVAACSDATAPSADAALDLTAAFTSIPQGYADAALSYAGGPPPGGVWMAGARGDRLLDGVLMGGGVRDAFLGGIGMGRGRGHEGPFGGGLACGGTGGTGGTFDAASGRVTCTDTRGGVAVSRSAQYTTAAGAVQPAFDSLTTNTVDVRTTARGTVSVDSASGRAGFGFAGRHGGRGGRGGGRHGGRGGRGGLLLGDTATILSATITVESEGARTVTGLAEGSTRRTVDGASRASESITGTSSRGAFTATRLAADTTRGLVIPVRGTADAPAYPTAGTVIRTMQASVTYTGDTPATASRREVVTYDGSATARVVITEDGTTRTCTRPLPRGPLSCS